MTEAQARTTANILIGAAAIGAAYIVISNPSLRRMAWQLARTAIGATGPAWVMAEARRAWSRGPDTPPPPASVGGREPRDMIGA